MMAKTMRSVVGVSLVAVLLAGSAEAAGGRFSNRQGAQGARIRQGVATGSLTGREAVRLGADHAQNRAMVRRARADGDVTARERARIEREQNRDSRQIYRQKHDEQSGKPRGGSLPARNARQEGRIEQGATSGSLTGREAAFLARREQRLSDITRRLAQDGLSPQERARLQQQRDVLSKQIYHQKHDDQTAPAPEPVPGEAAPVTP